MVSGSSCTRLLRRIRHRGARPVRGGAPPGLVDERMRRTLRGVLVFCAVAAAAMAGWGFGVRASRSASVPPVLGGAPTYTLINQLGRPVSSGQFRGKVQIVTFLFPYCTTYCPLVAAHLTNFEQRLRDARLRDRVQLVAFDVDPRHTGPKQMRAFLRDFGWNPSDRHWQYLTGTAPQIRRVVTGGFHIFYQQVSLVQEARAAARLMADGCFTVAPTVVNPLAEGVHV